MALIRIVLSIVIYIVSPIVAIVWWLFDNIRRINMIAGIIGYVRRNLAEIVNLIEAVIRVAGSLASLTPTAKDDSVVAAIKAGFGKIKDWLLKAGE